MSPILFPPPNLSTFLETLLFVLLSFNSPSSEQPENIPEFRMVGGAKCSVKKHPFVVSIVFPTRQAVCAGALIYPRYVLTAAHCFGFRKTSEWPSVRIQAGSSTPVWSESKKRSGEEPQVRRVSNVYFPDDSGKPYHHNDIALVHVDKAFSLDHSLFSAQLPPPPSNPVRFCTTALGMGWGGKKELKASDDKSLSRLSRSLQCLELPMVNNSICRSFNTFENIAGRILCSRFKKKGKGICFGDSGGPIVCKDQPNIVIGIVKGAEGCGQGNKMVYTKMDAYLKWIYKYVPSPSKVQERSLEEEQEKKQGKEQGKEQEQKKQENETENGSGNVHVANVLLVVLLLINVILY